MIRNNVLTGGRFWVAANRHRLMRLLDARAKLLGIMLTVVAIAYLGCNQDVTRPVGPSTGVEDVNDDAASDSGNTGGLEPDTSFDAVSSVPGPLAAACGGTSTAFADGPSCCLGRTVLRPYQRVCQSFSNLSPNRDTYGVYDGAKDRPNTLSSSSNTLQICAVYVVENGEGTSWPHGPYGNLYVDVFPASEPLAKSADNADTRRIGRARVLRGPHRTHDTTDEWLDDEFQRYRNFGIFPWGQRSAVIIRVWESDGSEDGNFWGRRNDVLGMELVRQSDFQRGSRWVALHKYTNDHPRRRTNQIAGWVLLSTGGSCPR